MKNVKKSISRLLCMAIVTILVSVATAIASETPIELTFNMQFPARSWAATQEWGPWAQNIETLSQGKLKIKIFWGATLSSPLDAYDSAIKGIADIAYSSHSYSPGRFPIMSLFELPGFGRTMMANQHILYDLYKQFPEITQEHVDAQILWLGAIREMTFLTVAKPIKNYEDLKGMRIRAAGGSSAETIKVWDAAPILMPITDTYVALQRKVVDGTTADWNVLEAFKFPEVTRYATIAPIPGNSMFVVMNANKFNSLPKDIQNILIAQGEKHWLEFHQLSDQEAYQAIQRFQKMPEHEVIFLSNVEREKWLKATQPVFDRWISTIEAKGLPGKEIFQKATQLAEKYNKIYAAPWENKQ